MSWIYISLILLGMVALVLSLRPTYDICSRNKSLGWNILLFLIVLFILGYGGMLYFQLSQPATGLIYAVISCILCGGGMFVFVVSKLSHKSIIKLEEVADVERHNALHDSLTDLPNRKHILQRMTEYAESQTPFTLLSIDLNNFKQVNDALGHHYGDELLIAVSARFRELLPSNTFVSRMGGDEFALIVNTNEEKAYLHVVNLIHDTLKQPFQVMGYDINVYLSIGVSLFPNQATELDELLKQADIAMYESKKHRQKYVLYRDEFNAGGSEKLVISTGIKAALEREEFELHYQPIVNPDNSIYGAEALIRWPQADGSYISPNKFIGIAEQSVLIGEITAWVLNKSFLDLQEMKKGGFTGCLHINLSAQDLQNDAVYQLALQFSEKDPSCVDQLVFEITESAMMKDLYAGKKMMLKLSEIGFRFSIDDFGTGFSSLSLLRELPVNQIKIDRSFITNMSVGSVNHSIVKSTLFLAKSLNCSVVAEGVENQNVGQELSHLECDYMQGFHYSRAIPLTKFVDKFITA
ncbi:putative bifunctional diguanylate cyclase/phosphodiesterase [Marinomonas sp. GJ51-6]|uniref:putative bifunctional diguanylate cyclase/phosphodiesterase n=1 Tax=Marinomonas sp. GJ51-6 TaxID=2992802 RepID=UPI0029344E25|nr:EAL domain-containing protein [Marinomonas sp. GJ51-6]WOD08443.1 EAL domain-containing protein [Marinomonas sp. GJ51-6]